MGSVHTRLRIINNTNTDITNTSVSEITNFDWDSGARPDMNFQNISIKSGSSVEHREEVNSKASNCPFRMTLTFADGTQDSFRIHQKYAAGLSRANFDHSTKSHIINYARKGRNVLEITIENTEEQKENAKAEELRKDGESLIYRQQYEEAIKKLDDALNLANQKNTIDLIKESKTNAKKLLNQKINNQKAETLNEEGVVVMNRKKYEASIRIFDEALLTFANEHQTILSIKSNKTKAQELLKRKNDNQEAEQLLSEGQFEINQKKYEAAISKFNKSLSLANENFTISKINTALEKVFELQKRQIQNDRAEQLKNEGDLIMSGKMYEEAIKKFDEALSLATDEYTITSIMSNKSKAQKLLQMMLQDQKAQRLKEEGDADVAQKHYELAIRKFDEALALANEQNTVNSLNVSKFNAEKLQQKQILNQKAEELKEEGEEALANKLYEEGIIKFSEALGLASDCNLIASLKVKNVDAQHLLEMQIRNKRAEEFNKNGEIALEQQKYNESLKMFEEALILANEDDTIKLINKNKAKAIELLKEENQKKLQNLIKASTAKVEVLKSEGEELLKQKQYIEALKKFNEALALANETDTIHSLNVYKVNVLQLLQKQLENKKAEELIKNGETALELKEYHVAIRKFEEALLLANDSVIIDNANLYKINAEKALEKHLQNQKVEKLVNEGKFFLTQKNFIEAMGKFDEALSLTDDKDIIDSVNLNKSTIQQFLEKQIDNFKARQLQREGEFLMDQKMYEDAEKKFDEALTLASDEDTVKMIKFNKTQVREFIEKQELYNLEQVSPE